ncbi:MULTISPECIES: TetR/AcrR family transcriptional regulator [unclassified Brevibacterium]|uniref:TetR/AcrR family transcriptional regulator n=1 Tax=unclassified Brevibacterium TaxID=2614124 RepID=UPI0010F7BF64|nr:MULTISPECIES: TetR/AcrR family transcriptional regulator [unclassified Brevibacterium]MCM1011279.1 TetR/AcrR family transcriptional regulator [Brevibacterium sp. XM4083]
MNTENLSDRRRRTRSTLVEAGVSVFAVKGIEGASIEEICEAGGLTRGAFYSNFSSRDDLVLATLEIRAAETLDRLDATIQRWKEQLDDTDAAEIRPLLTQFVEEIFTEKLHTVADAIAEQEVELYCLRVPELYARYQELDAGRRERLARLVRTAIENVGAVPTIPLDSLLTILISLFTHLSLQSAAGRDLRDPVDIEPDLIVEVLLRFLDFTDCATPEA